MKNSILGCEYIGKHMEYEVKDVIKYLNRYLMNNYPVETVVEQFEALDAEDRIFEDGFGLTNEEPWVDTLGAKIYAFSELYELTKEETDVRFIILDDNSYIYVLLVKGDPAIEEIVQTAEKINEPGIAIRNRNRGIQSLYFDAEELTIQFRN